MSSTTTQTQTVTESIRGLPRGLPRLTPVDRTVFYDGLRTSGQHPPIEGQLFDFEDFPKNITGRTVWKPEELKNNENLWIHHLTDAELAELEAAADAYIQSGKPLTKMDKNSFRLPTLEPLLERQRDEVLNGIGFIVWKGFPMERLGKYKAGLIQMGMSTHFGYLLCQNKEGLLLGHVVNQNHDYVNHLDKIKISRTNAPQFYHTDECDIVSLLCLAQAEEGGLSGSCSAHTVWNELRETDPQALKTLSSPIWYVDRKGEVTDGQEPYYRCPVFFMEPGGQHRVYVKWDPYFVKSLARFSDKGEIPPLSEEQKRAMESLEACCKRNCVEFACETGDMQFVSCCQLFHARTGFTDAEPPAEPRYLLRTWMGTPEHEGGWSLPFHDSFHPKRGGIQVEDNPPIADPLTTM